MKVIFPAYLLKLQLITPPNSRLAYWHLPSYLFGDFFDIESNPTFSLRNK